MFFDLILLNREHKSLFNFAWIAATRGVRHVSKRDILALDIAKLCGAMVEYVCSESDVPQQRFSLRLSAILLNGNMKIYRQKTIYIIGDLVQFLTVVSKPLTLKEEPYLDNTGMFATPPPPINKKRIKKRPPVEKNTPESQLEQLVASIISQETISEASLQQELIILEARLDEVTLRETQFPRHVEIEDFGDLGDDPFDDQFFREITESDRPAPLSLQPIQEVAEPLEEVRPALSPEKPRPKRKLFKVYSSSSESSQEIGPEVVTVEAQIHAVADFEPPKHKGIAEVESMQVGEILSVQVEPRHEVEVSIQAEERLVLREIQAETVNERDIGIQKLRRGMKRKMDAQLEKLLIVNKPRKIVRIDRCEYNSIEWINTDSCPLPEGRLKLPNLTRLLNIYLMRQKESLEDLEEVRRQPPGRLTPPAPISAEIDAVPMVVPERIEPAATTDEGFTEPSIMSPPLKRYTQEIEYVESKA